MNKKIQVIILSILIMLFSLSANAGSKRYGYEVWSGTDGKWHGGVRDYECDQINCVEIIGEYRTKKGARAESKHAAKEKNKKEGNSVYNPGDGRTDGGLCSQPGVEC